MIEPTTAHMSEQSASAANRVPRDAGMVDSFGRVHQALRISVTDACNIRCQYCMPAEGAQFLPQKSLLSFEQIEQFVRSMVSLGVSKIRLTGGEPLLRRRLADLVARLAAIEGVTDLALTTNGLLLEQQIDELYGAGLRRLNISLDTLSAETFRRISRRDGLKRVLSGIEAAREYSGLELKLNALVLREVNLDGVLELVEYALSRAIPLRFIEFMPLDAEKAWAQRLVVTGAELRSLIVANLGELVEIPSADPARPARDFRLKNQALHGEGGGVVGFIDSVSSPFCGACDRLRLTADGKLRNCLFGLEEWDVAGMLAEMVAASNATESEELSVQLQRRVRECVIAKHASHGIADPNFEAPSRAMYQIGG